MLRDAQSRGATEQVQLPYVGARTWPRHGTHMRKCESLCLACMTPSSLIASSWCLYVGRTVSISNRLKSIAVANIAALRQNTQGSLAQGARLVRVLAEHARLSSRYFTVAPMPYSGPDGARVQGARVDHCPTVGRGKARDLTQLAVYVSWPSATSTLLKASSGLLLMCQTPC